MKSTSAIACLALVSADPIGGDIEHMDIDTNQLIAASPHQMHLSSLIQSAPPAKRASHVYFDEQGAAPLQSMVDSGFLESGNAGMLHTEVGDLLGGVHSLFQNPPSQEEILQPLHRIQKHGSPGSMMEVGNQEADALSSENQLVTEIKAVGTSNETDTAVERSLEEVKEDSESGGFFGALGQAATTFAEMLR